MFKKLFAGVIIVALTFVGLVAVATPARATGASSDATLADLETRGADTSQTYLWGDPRMENFSPTQDFYDVYTPRQTLVIYANPNDPGATITVSSGDGNDIELTTTSSWYGDTRYRNAIVNLREASDQRFTVTVTAADNVTTKIYTLNVSSGVMIATPQIISISPSSISTSGGTRGLLRIRNYTPCIGYSYNYTYLDSDGNTQVDSEPFNGQYINTDSQGVTKVALSNWAPARTFRDSSIVANLVVANDSSLNECAEFSAYAEATAPNAIHFFNPAVTSTTMPDTISQDSVFVVRGPGINSVFNTRLRFELFNPATGSYLQIYTNEINNNSVQIQVSSWNNSEEWRQSQNLQLIVTDYASGWTSPYPNDVVIYRQNVKFTPEMVTSVSVSPAKGPTRGGNQVTITGHGICTQREYTGVRTIVKIGGNLVQNFYITKCDFNSSSNGIAFDGISTATFSVPPGPAGPADITVDMGYGATTLSQKYIYGDAPTVASITPSTVANTGGSIVTLTGTNFGISGTPVVIIDGQKSPYVLRISQTKVRAMVPRTASVGRVEVDILSSSGGGGLSQLASLTYAARSTDPVISNITPASGGLAGGDSLVIYGNGFNATSSGVTFGGRAAKILSATATSLTVETPAGIEAGAISVSVATPNGLANLAGGFTYLPNPGVTGVSRTTIASTATGDDAKVTITGVGFGTSGKITVASESSLDYVSSNQGTVISGITIPTSAAGSVEISILPAGATKAYTTSVNLTSPRIDSIAPVDGATYFDGETTFTIFGDRKPLLGGYNWGIPVSAANNGGDVMVITGSGFGPVGQIKLGSQVIPVLTYSGTRITFASPSGFVPGVYDLRVIPSDGSLFGIVPNAVTIGIEILGTAKITSVSAATPPSNGDPSNHFWPNTTDSDLYTVYGNGLSGTDSGATTKVYMEGATDFRAGNDAWNLLDVVSSSDTEMLVRIPRNLELWQWNALKIVTNRGTATLALAVYYDDLQPQDNGQPPNNNGGPPPQDGSPYLAQTSEGGLCSGNPVGSVLPAVVSFSNNYQGFGGGGVVTIGGVAISPTAITWDPDGNFVTVNFANQTDIHDVWGLQVVEVASSTLTPVDFSFNCSIRSTVTTKIDGQTGEFRVEAGTPLPLSSNINDLIPGTSWTEPETNYEYQTAAARAANGPYRPGLPTGAGTFYVRARIVGAGYDRVKYSSLTNLNSVRVIIAGNEITLTPNMAGGGSVIAYKGQLGSSTNGNGNDIGLTIASPPSAPVPDPITTVTFEFRNHACTSAVWSAGLPKDVAVFPRSCGGDDTSLGSWDVRVKNFEMSATGENRAGYYLPQFPIFNLTITKAQLTVLTVEAQKAYNGDRCLTLGSITVSGAAPGDYPTLDPSFAQSACFADSTPGADKTVILTGPLVLAGAFDRNYEITNPSMVVKGTIYKANNVLKVAPSATSVVLGQTSTINLTVTTTDVLTGQNPIPAAHVNEPVLISATPGVCTLIGTVVTAEHPGDCVIEATQAASDNYNAGVSYHKSPSLTESVQIKVYAGAGVVSVVADDMKVAVGTFLSPSYSATGLLNRDTFDGVNFDYYLGSSLLTSAPTAIGTYRIVPKNGYISTQTQMAYSSTFKYIAGTLIITATPPEITSISPGHGPEAGGNTVVITGAGFGALTSIRLGDRNLRKPAFTVNGDGTQVSFIVPAGVGGLDIALNAGEAEADSLYTYDAPYSPPAAVQDNGGLDVPPVVNSIAPANGPEAGGNTVVITGTGLAALTSIIIGTNPIDGTGFTVNQAGTQVSFIAPAGTGTQDLTLVAGLLETTTTYTYHAASASVSTPSSGQPWGPVVDAISPAHGPESGGNTVVITGAGFGALTSIKLGSTILGETSYSINGDGTQVTLVMPPGTGTLHISLFVGERYTDVVYTYETSVKGGGSTSSHLVLMLDLAVGTKLAGQKVAINGGGLAAGSPYSLVLHSNPVVIYRGVTDSKGDFDQKFVIQTKACLSPGKHTFELHGTTPDGKDIMQTAVFSLLANCVVGGTVQKTSAKQLTLSGFLFAFRSSVITKDAKHSLDHLMSFIKGATSVNLFGYTETDTTSAQVKAANLKLAKARALAVQAYLKSKGIVTKWATIGKGGTNPVSVIDQFKNRRVEIQANF